ncbi:uncharacterized protein LOC113002744 isoform X2 [Solenopsis invicta]|uniref:uncharacterized protein LOC113002744 isoform X2 n=1 Tax=Solenopsis invicta TaxID=13686 RepID=UPI00193D17CD|nr:uncharacterized protein LOC113002744 isoform X2 [Solenopsis invicta]
MGLRKRFSDLVATERYHCHHSNIKGNTVQRYMESNSKQTVDWPIVFVEDIGKIFTFQLTEVEAARATTDLVNKEYARQKKTQISKTNERLDLCNTFMEKDLSPVPCSSISEVNDSLDITSAQSDTVYSVPHTSTQNVEESTDNEKTLFIWSSKTVYLLLEKYEERMNEFSSGTKRHSKIWENIASEMNKVDPNIAVSGPQCQSKMNSIKKIYRKIIDHNNISGNDRKSWQYFERMNELFGKSGWANPKATVSDSGPSSLANSTDENSNIKKPAIKKLKSDKLLDEFVKQMKEDRQEREKKKEERQLIILQELKEQKEKQHKEKMDIMKTFCEAISGKKLFD